MLRLKDKIEANVTYADRAGSATTAGSANSVAWGNVSGKPSTFTPTSHTHTKSQITDFPTSLKNPTALTVQGNGTTIATYDGSAAKTVNITKESIGLGNVDNTADSAKNVRYAASAGAVAWGNVSGKPSTFPPSSHTHSKSDVGLGNVDNTADSAKSVKYAASAGSAGSVAWDNVSGKPSTFTPASHTHTKSQITDFPTSLKNPTALTIQTNGTVAATYDGSAAKTVNITKSSVGLGSVDNTADSAKSVKYATTAGSANAVAWGNVSGKPSTFTPASHVHDRLERTVDTRSTTTKPSDYKDGFKFIGIKTLKAAGISESESEYCCLIGMNGWTDKSGGGATEIAIDVSGRMFYRHQNMNGADDSFDKWRLVITSDYVVNDLTTNYLNMPLSANMGRRLADMIYNLNKTKVNQPIYSTTDLTPGVSDLADGQIYIVYYN